jgi:hypothetical protein
VHEPALAVEAPFQHDGVQRGMEARDLPVLMQDLGEGEDHLPVREPQQQPLVQVLAEQQGALLRARRAKMEDLTQEGRKYSARQSGLVQRMRATPLE